MQSSAFHSRIHKFGLGRSKSGSNDGKVIFPPVLTRLWLSFIADERRSYTVLGQRRGNQTAR